MKKDQSCRTCAYWGKPAEKRAIADRYHACNAPAPSRHDFPASIYGTLDRRLMSRDDGVECPVWTTRAPAVRSEAKPHILLSQTVRKT